MPAKKQRLQKKPKFTTSEVAAMSEKEKMEFLVDEIYDGSKLKCKKDLEKALKQAKMENRHDLCKLLERDLEILADLD